jgi:hypothetical protein
MTRWKLPSNYVEIVDLIKEGHRDWFVSLPRWGGMPVFTVNSPDGCYVFVDRHWFTLEGVANARSQIEEVFEAQRLLRPDAS